MIRIWKSTSETFGKWRNETSKYFTDHSQEIEKAQDSVVYLIANIETNMIRTFWNNVDKIVWLNTWTDTVNIPMWYDPC